MGSMASRVWVILVSLARYSQTLCLSTLSSEWDPPLIWAASTPSGRLTGLALLRSAPRATLDASRAGVLPRPLHY